MLFVTGYFIFAFLLSEETTVAAEQAGAVVVGANLSKSLLEGIESRYKRQVHGRIHRPQKSATTRSFAATTDSAEVNEVGPYKKGKREIESSGKIFVLSRLNNATLLSIN